MNSQETNKTETEEKILEAAKKVFIQKGMTGARMQEIADEAKINKSLLHYYYRSKDKLFSAVAKVLMRKFAPKAIKVLNENIPFEEKITSFVHEYMDLLLDNPHLPLFVLNELNRNPDGIAGVLADAFSEMDFNPVEVITRTVNEEIEKGTIRSIDPKQLFVNVFSLCIFPIAGRPLLQRIVFENNQEEYDQFIQERKNEIPRFIINSIKI